MSISILNLDVSLLLMRTFVYTRILICAPSYVRSLAPLYHPDTLVNPDTYIVMYQSGLQRFRKGLIKAFINQRLGPRPK